ncbi:MAG: M50 family metallopeptidase [Candidatus Omnitrophica bacterium]|nr:M50 family metallopeptidase [Candidatus Omnitrophota bacterium]
MIIRVFKVLIGIALLPITVAATIAFSSQLAQIQQIQGLAAYFLKGVIIYLVMHLVLYKPNYFYVLGHELAHALATFLCGGQVKSFRVSSRGGGVLTTKSNFFIALFPYFFPTYTLLFWLTYFLVSLFRDISAYAPQFLFVIGFTLTMHLVMTIETMKVKQSDIFKTGYLFSVSLIYTLNVVLLGLILSVIFADFSFSAFFQASVDRTAGAYYAIYEYLFL